MSKDFPICPYCGRSDEAIELYDEIMERQMDLRTELAEAKKRLAETEQLEDLVKEGK